MIGSLFLFFSSYLFLYGIDYISSFTVNQINTTVSNITVNFSPAIYWKTADNISLTWGGFFFLFFSASAFLVMSIFALIRKPQKFGDVLDNEEKEEE